MAKPKSKSAKSDWGVDFVNCELSKEERNAVQVWDRTFEEIMGVLIGLVADGYKLSVSFDKAHDCAVASITSPYVSAEERRQCLTARGPAFVEAVTCLVYKHSVVLDGDWGEVGNSLDLTSKWG